MSHSLQPRGLQPARLLCPWDSPGKNTGVGCSSLLQRIFLTQRSNLGLLHCRQILYGLRHRRDLNWRIIALQCCVGSAVLQHESAISIHVSPPSWACLPPTLSLIWESPWTVTGLLGQEACSCWDALGGIFAASGRSRWAPRLGSVLGSHSQVRCVPWQLQ